MGAGMFIYVLKYDYGIGIGGGQNHAIQCQSSARHLIGVLYSNLDIDKKPIYNAGLRRRS